MKIARHDLTDRVCLIAEIGNNHEGDVDVALRMIRAAAEAGADAVKFQTIRPAHLVRKTDKARLEQLQRFALSWDVYGDLAACAREAGVHFLSTPFDLGAVEFLASHVDAIKISSGDNDFLVLLERAAATGLPMLLSTGLAGKSHVDRAVSTIRRSWQDRAINPGLALLHCVVAYPTPDTDANLGAIRDLEDSGADVVGYSDHTIGSCAALAAVALGARVIEKHFTLDHAYSDFRDHQLAATPEEFRVLARDVRRIEAMMRPHATEATAAEQENASAVRRSIVADRALPPGHMIELKDLRWVRPGDGLSCGREDELVGRRLRVAVEAGESLSPNVVE